MNLRGTGSIIQEWTIRLHRKQKQIIDPVSPRTGIGNRTAEIVRQSRGPFEGTQNKTTILVCTWDVIGSIWVMDDT